VYESNGLPTRDELCLSPNHTLQKMCDAVGIVCKVGIVPCDRVVRKLRKQCAIIKRCCILKGSNAQMARRRTNKHRSALEPVAWDHFSRRRDSETARGWNTKGVHRLTHEVLTQHWSKRSAPIATARKSRSTRTFQMKIDACARWRALLTDQDGATITKHRSMTVLMPSVRLRNRHSVWRKRGARRKLCALRANFCVARFEPDPKFARK